MKHQTHTHRLDILKTHIEAVQTAAREMSNPDEYGIPFTIFEVLMLGQLVFQIDEAQEHMHSVFAGQLEDPLMAIQIKQMEIQQMKDDGKHLEAELSIMEIQRRLDMDRRIQQMEDENKHLQDELNMLLNQKLTMQLNQQQVTNHA